MFIDEIYSKSPKKIYETMKVTHIHTDEIWSIDLTDMIDYRISNIEGFRYIFNIIEIIELTWCTLLK